MQGRLRFPGLFQRLAGDLPVAIAFVRGHINQDSAQKDITIDDQCKERVRQSKQTTLAGATWPDRLERGATLLRTGR